MFPQQLWVEHKMVERWKLCIYQRGQPSREQETDA